MKKTNKIKAIIALFAVLCLSLCGSVFFAIAAPGDTNGEGWVEDADGYYYEPDVAPQDLFAIEDGSYSWMRYHISNIERTAASFTKSTAFTKTDNVLATGDAIFLYYVNDGVWGGNGMVEANRRHWDFKFKVDFTNVTSGKLFYYYDCITVIFDITSNTITIQDEYWNGYNAVHDGPYNPYTVDSATVTSTFGSTLAALTGEHTLSFLMEDRVVSSTSEITSGNHGLRITVGIDGNSVTHKYDSVHYGGGMFIITNYTNTDIPIYSTVYNKVKYNFNGGSGTPAFTYVENLNHKIAAPSDPTYAGYSFDYWYYDDASVAFDFANTEITSDITLTAHWTQVGAVRTVTFVAAYDTIAPIEVTDGGTLGGLLPTAAVIGAYSFGGWYTTNNYAIGTEFTSSTPVTADTTVYAKYNAPASPNGEGWVFDGTDGYFYEDNPAIIDWFDVDDGNYFWKKYTLTNIDRTQSVCNQPVLFTRADNTVESYKGVFLFYQLGQPGADAVYDSDHGNVEPSRRHWDFKFKLDFTGITSGSFIYYFDPIKIVIDFTANTITMTDEQWYGWNNQHNGPYQTVAFDSATVTSAFGSTLAALTGVHTVTLLMEDRVLSSTSEITGANKGMRVTIGIDANSVVGTFTSALHYYGGMFGLCNFTNTSVDIIPTYNLKKTVDGVVDKLSVDSPYALPAAVKAGKVFVGWDIGGTLYAQGTSYDLGTYTEMTAVFIDFYMGNGAEVRLNGSAGLRFTTYIAEADKTLLTVTYGLTVEYGTYVTATISETPGHLNIVAENWKLSGVPANYDAFTGVLTDFVDGYDYRQIDFNARGYVKITYADSTVKYIGAIQNSNTRSVAYVAYSALNDFSAEYNDAEGFIYLVGEKYYKANYSAADIESLTYLCNGYVPA